MLVPSVGVYWPSKYKLRKCKSGKGKRRGEEERDEKQNETEEKIRKKESGVVRAMS
jgi:hypothetical protein